MLSVKSNVLKSYASGLLCLFAAGASATPAKVTPANQLLPMLLSLGLVLGIIVVGAMVMKRFNLGNVAGNKNMKVVSQLPLGTKEKLIVVEVQGEQHLLGVTSQQISYLQTLNNPISQEQPQVNFAEQFKQLMNKKQ